MRKYLVLPAFLLLLACSGGTEALLIEAPPIEARAEPLFGTLYSNIREPRRMLITNEATWSALWAEMLPSVGGPSTPPFVDFSRENVVVAAMGERRGAGFAIEIVDVARTSSAVRVHIASTMPAAACTGSDVISTPLDAVRIPKTADAVEFAERSIVLSCS